MISLVQKKRSRIIPSWRPLWCTSTNSSIGEHFSVCNITAKIVMHWGDSGGDKSELNFETSDFQAV